MFRVMLAVDNPFVQLMDTIHSPLFWLMTLGFFALMGYFYMRFVQNSNAQSEEELYLAAILAQKGYAMRTAQIENQAGPFAQMPPDTEILGISRTTYWRTIAENDERREITFWAKILYIQRGILTVKWLPDLHNPNLNL